MTSDDKSVFRPGRKLVGIVVGFVGCALLARVGLGSLGYTALDPRTNEPRSQFYFSYLSRPAVEDVLVIGSSRVLGGLEGTVLQDTLRASSAPTASVYKMGVPGLRPFTLLEILDDLVAPRPPRELLVIAIETRFFVRPRAAFEDAPDAEWRGEWEAEGQSRSVWDLFEGVRALWTLDWIFNPMTQRAARFQHERAGEHLTLEQRWRREKQSQHALATRQDGFEDVEWVWSDESTLDQLAFDQCLERLAALPCDVLFVRMPLVEGFDAEHMPVVFPRFEAEVLPRIAERGFVYEDLNRPPFPRARELFLGITHLNYEGCLRTSRLLATDVLAPALARRAGKSKGAE